MEIYEYISTKFLNYFGVEQYPVVSGWPLMEFSTMITLNFIYLLIIKMIGPNLMRFRKAFDLTQVIKIYNIFQIVSCALILINISQIENTTKFRFECHHVYANNQLAYYFWWTMCLKLSEFLETIFFVLRKKQSQVTNLHVYHHVSTYLLMWYATKYAAVPMTAFYVILNSAVHILMYSYYLLSTTENKKALKILQKIKKYITIIQMIQFTVILANAGQAVFSTCSTKVAYKINLMILLIPNVMLVYYMFYNFYKKSYRKTN